MATIASASRSCASPTASKLVRAPEMLDPAFDGHDEMLLAERVVDRLHRRIDADERAVAPLHQRPGLPGRLGGPALDLGSKLVRGPSAGRIVEEVDGADPPFDGVLAEQVVEEQVGGPHPGRRRRLRQAGVPEPDIHPLATLVPARDRAVGGQVHVDPIELQPAERARLPARVVLPGGSRAGAAASQVSATGRSAGSPSGETTSACRDAAPFDSSQARPLWSWSTLALISGTIEPGSPASIAAATRSAAPAHQPRTARSRRTRRHRSA